VTVAADLTGRGAPELPDDMRAAVVDGTREIVDELIAVRRDLHAHPELGRAEVRTSAVVAARLSAAGLHPALLPGGVGVVCEIGTGAGGVTDGGDSPLLALRADLDGLPVPDEKDVPYRSTVAGRSHACGHDVHTAIVLGAGLLLAGAASRGSLPGRVRLIFQPAEELTPGGAVDVLGTGALDGVQRIFCVHCDPRSDVGTVGLRVGPITGSADHVQVRLTGPGGHTARPHLTADLVYALSKVATDVPAVLSRRVDPRSGLSVVWGHVAAGTAPNAIPREGVLSGTVRALDASVWDRAPQVVEQAVRAVVAPYGVGCEVAYTRGVPPVVNDAGSTRLLAGAAFAVVGPDSVFETEQSLGGEDFAWYLAKVPGALARLGVRRPGDTTERDLHQGSFDVDERAIGVGVRLLSAAALLGLLSLS
jgi:amidohydrolase